MIHIHEVVVVYGCYSYSSVVSTYSTNFRNPKILSSISSYTKLHN